MTVQEPTRVRRVLHRKRAVVRDSLSVVNATWRTLRHDRFLWRVLIGVTVATLVGLTVWKLVGKAARPGERTKMRPLVIGARLVAVLCVQYIVASWLYARWTGERDQRARHLWRRLARRLPAFFCCAAILGWLDYATRTSTASALIRTAASFAFGYALSYAVPAAAVYRSGMLHAFRRSYEAFRKTFGADLFAWSGVWLVTGFVALITAIPEAFDFYSPGTAPRGESGFVARLVGWGLVVPISLGALALSAGFCTVIFFALARNQAPAEYPKAAVETVSGLQLDDN